LLDASSGTLTKTGYQTFGESGSTVGTFRYTGARIDAETNGLYDFRARMYSPTLGRFVQADPSGTKGDINLYAYVGNDPLNAVDPSGLETQIGLAGGVTLAWILGVNGSINPGISIPDNLTNIGGYQFYVTVQVQGYVGLGGYAGAGLSVAGGSSSGPLPLASATPTWQAEADAGYGPSVGVSVGGTRSGCNYAGQCTWDAPSGGSFTPVPKIGAGYGLYAGAGTGGSVTLATPTFSQIGAAGGSLFSGASK
jgi:RHS repeat-associated protein